MNNTEQMTAKYNLAEKLRDIDWTTVNEELTAYGCTRLTQLLSPEVCDELAAMYADNDRFRTHIHLARHGFGKGEYKYFGYPLPDIISTLRTELYPGLADIANRWNALMNIDVRYPISHQVYLDNCHAAGQIRPTPLLLQYREGDFNCLHQDLYGDLAFPLQVAFLLSDPDSDFTGGEFVMTEQRPRMQTRPEVVRLDKGDAVIFAVHHRPVQGTKGIYRVNMRHGVSKIRSGQRHTLGIIFHDAQ